MDGHKRYSIGLLSLVFAEMLILVGTSFYLEPLVGDMTRLGAYAENDFGWNKPQQTFAKDAPPLRRAYDQPSDILVIGDSFSFAGNYGMLNFPWQTFLAAETGFSISSISHYTQSEPIAYDPKLLTAIVNSETFQKSPPRILIMEIVERQLDIVNDVPGDCQPHHPLQGKPDFTFQPISDLVADKAASRKKIRPPFKEQIAYAMKYLTTFPRWKKDEDRIVYELGLTTPKLFSHTLSDRLLVYSGDVKKSSWDKNKRAGIRCKLVNMQNLVQQNGKTLFVAMVVPDKLTAYAKYLQDQSLAKLSPIGYLAQDPWLHVVRLDLALQAVIDSGGVDVYLPNDTHWAYLGHQTAAKTLAAWLKDFPGDPAKP